MRYHRATLRVSFLEIACVYGERNLVTSKHEHEAVQTMVDQATPEERLDLRNQAESTLAQVNYLMGRHVLTKDENKAAEIAIETLVRLEATAQNKGWWFRAKRRLQLTQMYLGS